MRNILEPIRVPALRTAVQELGRSHIAHQALRGAIGIDHEFCSGCGDRVPGELKRSARNKENRELNICYPARYPLTHPYSLCYNRYWLLKGSVPQTASAYA